MTDAARLAESLHDGRRKDPPFVLSVGSTPTAHASATFSAQGINATLELHAGNYVFHDLQQLATSLISPTAIAHRLIATVVSLYPGRGKAMLGSGEERSVDEAMIDVGGLSLSKDTGPIKGWGKVVGVLKDENTGLPGQSTGGNWLLNEASGWTVSRISQEHGILANDGTTLSGAPVKENDEFGPSLKVGDRVAIIGQHACLVAAAQPWYYVVDSDDEGLSPVHGKRGYLVKDIWVPWKGW